MEYVVQLKSEVSHDELRDVKQWMLRPAVPLDIFLPEVWLVVFEAVLNWANPVFLVVAGCPLEMAFEAALEREVLLAALASEGRAVILGVGGRQTVLSGRIVGLRPVWSFFPGVHGVVE
jgi:hypothetical protein